MIPSANSFVAQFFGELVAYSGARTWVEKVLIWCWVFMGKYLKTVKISQIGSILLLLSVIPLKKLLSLEHIPEVHLVPSRIQITGLTPSSCRVHPLLLSINTWS